MFKLEQIGEKTINRIAEMALASQIEQVEHISVQVKTDPEKLAKGILESIAINGEGLILNSALRVQEMRIDLNHIAVYPLKALLGNIQLTRPSQGTIRVVLNEKDIEQALHPGRLRQLLESVRQVFCRISEQGQIIITTQLEDRRTGEIEEIFIMALPGVNLKGEIFLEEVRQTEDRTTASVPVTPRLQGMGRGECPAAVNEIILREVIQVLNFNSFHIDGLDLKIQQLTTKSGQLILQGIAVMTKFPKA